METLNSVITKQPDLSRRRFLRLAGVSTLAVATAHLAMTSDVDAKDARVDRRISLAPTSSGRKVGASGHARVRSRNGKQGLTVEVEANVKAGTRYSVYVTNGGSTVKAGTVVISAIGEGEMELKNYDGLRLPSGVSPVTSITKVTVQNSKGTTVLSGRF